MGQPQQRARVPRIDSQRLAKGGLRFHGNSRRHEHGSSFGEERGRLHRVAETCRDLSKVLAPLHLAEHGDFIGDSLRIGGVQESIPVAINHTLIAPSLTRKYQRDSIPIYQRPIRTEVQPTGELAEVVLLGDDAILNGASVEHFLWILVVTDLPTLSEHVLAVSVQDIDVELPFRTERPDEIPGIQHVVVHVAL